jgi:hypothetical protein
MVPLQVATSNDWLGRYHSLANMSGLIMLTFFSLERKNSTPLLSCILCKNMAIWIPILYIFTGGGVLIRS